MKVIRFCMDHQYVGGFVFAVLFTSLAIFA